MSDSLPTQKKLISISQAAKFLGISIDTVRRWDNSGVLHSERPDGKNRYFSQSELEEHKSGKPLPISEAAKELGISPTTLRRLESRGLLKPRRNNAGERVYDKDSLKNFLNSDYFRRKNHNQEEISKSSPEEKDFSHDLITPKKPEDTESKNQAVESSPFAPPVSDETISDSNYQSSYRIPEILAVVVIFIFLSAIGVTNITLSEAQGSRSIQTPAVLSETITHEKEAEASISAQPKAAVIEVPEAKPTAEHVTLESIQLLLDEAADYSKEATEAAEEKIKEEGSGPNLDDFKIILAVRTSGADFINIREKPSTESGQLAKAKNGDTFEMVSRDEDWYEIKLNDGSNGFIPEEFAQIKEIN